MRKSKFLLDSKLLIDYNKKKDFTEEKVMFCKNCGSNIEDGATFCKNCGYKLEQATQVQSTPKKYCSHCGKEFDPLAVLCVHCGCSITPENASEDKNGMAVAGFVCSFFVPLLGWIFGGIGLNRSKKRNGKGKGFSIAAIAIASAMFVINLFML